MAVNEGNETDMVEKTDYVDTNIKLSIGQRLNYAISEFGYNSIYYWISGFMMFYYTDIIGVSAAAVAALTLWVRIFDAVNDPIIGSMADRSNSRWGKYKPWVGIGAVFMSGFIIILFSANPNWSYSFKVIYMWVVYIMVTLASTCCNMPFGALNGLLTSNSEERAKLSGMRMLFASIGINFMSVVAIPLIVFFSNEGGKRTARGFTLAVITLVILGLPTLIWSSVKVKEVVKQPKTQIKIPIKSQFAAFFKNRYSIVAALGFFMFGFLMYGVGALNIYYFRYVANNPALYSFVGLTGLIAGFVGAGFLSTRVYRKTLNKGRAIQLFFSFAIVFYGLLYIFQPTSMLFWISNTLAATCRSAGIALSYGVVPDAVDYGEYKTGIRVDGFIASFVSLMMKAGGAVGPALLLAWIGFMGYQPDIEQSRMVIFSLKAGISLVPALFALMIVIVYIPYNMDYSKHEEIRKELAKRRM